MKVVRILLVLGTLSGAPAVAAAQSPYAAVGAGLTWREPGHHGEGIDGPGHSATESVLFEGGWWITPSIGVEGSVQLQRRQTLSWIYSYTSRMDESATDRDMPIAAHLRGMLWRRRRLSIEGLIGGGFNWHRAESFTLVHCGGNFGSGPCVAVTPPETSDVEASWEPLLSGGLDLPIRAASHVYLVPTARLVYVRRREFLTGYEFRGPGNGSGLMWTGGLALRWSAH